jgi:hypothetical protein
MPAEPIATYIVTAHAALEMARRGISEGMVNGVMIAPEQRLLVRTGRVVLQSRMARGVEQKAALVRVFVDVDRTPPEVVTAYATSKIAKYWSPSHEG